MVPGNAGGAMTPQDLATTLSEELAGFRVSATERHVVIGHPALGLAAVVPTDDETAAMIAAAELTALAQTAGVTYPAMHFAISTAGVKPPWLIRASSMGVDIVSAMVRASASRPSFGQEAMEKVFAAIAGLPTAKGPVRNGLSPNFIRMTEACVERALAGRPVSVTGIEIGPADVAGSRFLLPAILVAAAQDWAVPVVASKGQGGFLIRLSSDPGAILGYRVSEIDASAPLLLFLPIVNLIRRSVVGGECRLDASVDAFCRFLTRNGLDAGAMEDVDVRVATSA